mmetsp:Transcript_17509/g.38167  ORF Transcript_17509/g.38167 Transcript_17509/m.38167 type:complete len:332 (+) Transcript_17509:1723-2718(+)
MRRLSESERSLSGARRMSRWKAVTSRDVAITSSRRSTRGGGTSARRMRPTCTASTATDDSTALSTKSPNMVPGPMTPSTSPWAAASASSWMRKVSASRMEERFCLTTSRRAALEKRLSREPLKEPRLSFSGLQSLSGSTSMTSVGAAQMCWDAWPLRMRYMAPWGSPCLTIARPMGTSSHSIRSRSCSHTRGQIRDSPSDRPASVRTRAFSAAVLACGFVCRAMRNGREISPSSRFGRSSAIWSARCWSNVSPLLLRRLRIIAIMFSAMSNCLGFERPTDGLSGDGLLGLGLLLDLPHDLLRIDLKTPRLELPSSGRRSWSDGFEVVGEYT